VNILGLKGALSIWRRVGYTNIKYAVEKGHILDGFIDLEPKEKFNKVMEIYQMGIGVGRLNANEEGTMDYDVFDCPICAEYESKRPVCTVITGSIQYIVDWAYGEGVKIAKETRCKAKGDDTCYFVIEDKD
jgi:predicted hydrocarbon binding protein